MRCTPASRACLLPLLLLAAGWAAAQPPIQTAGYENAQQARASALQLKALVS